VTVEVIVLVLPATVTVLSARVTVVVTPGLSTTRVTVETMVLVPPGRVTVVVIVAVVKILDVTARYVMFCRYVVPPPPQMGSVTVSVKGTQGMLGWNELGAAVVDLGLEIGGLSDLLGFGLIDGVAGEAKLGAPEGTGWSKAVDELGM
jgi:hypothetical protein